MGDRGFVESHCGSGYELRVLQQGLGYQYQLLTVMRLLLQVIGLRSVGFPTPTAITEIRGLFPFVAVSVPGCGLGCDFLNLEGFHPALPGLWYVRVSAIP